MSAKHTCPRNRWIHGKGWGCDTCDPAMIKARDEAHTRMLAHREALDKTAKHIYQTELRRLRRLGTPLAEAQRKASRETCIAIEGYDPETE